MSDTKADAALGSFFGHVATLLTGNLAARVLTLALYPILTRLYAPEVFGAFASVEAVLLVLASVCHLRLPMAILLPHEQREVDGLALGAFGATTAFALACQVVALLFEQPLAAAVKLQEHSWLLHCVPAAVFLSGVGMLLSQLGLREKRFKALAVARVGLSGGERGLAVLLGATSGAGLASLMISKYAGLVLQNAAMAMALGWRGLCRMFSAEAWAAMPAALSRYRRFPIYSMTDLVLTGALQLPVLLLAIAFSPTVAGFFSLCRRVLREPLNLLGQSLYRAYSERAAELLREGKTLGEFTGSFIWIMVDLCIIPLILVSLGGAELFTFLFGQQWATAGTYAAMLGGFYIINFMGMPLSALFDIQEKQRQRLGFDLLFLTTSAAGLLGGVALGNPAWSVGLFSLTSGLSFLARLRYLAGLAGLSGTGWSVRALSRVVRSLPVVLPLAAAKLLYPEPWLITLLTALCGGTHLALKASSPMLREPLLHLFRKKASGKHQQKDNLPPDKPEDSETQP